MALRKDKQKVLGEVFDDDRVRGFLEINERDGFDTDYLLLERAYRGMKAENFASFVDYFISDGHEINAKNTDGLSLLQVILDHDQSSEYRETLKKYGARI